MKTLILAAPIAFAILAWGMALNPAYANDEFWNSYYAAQNGYGYGDDGSARLRGTEALINEMRAARGAPPCTIGPISAWFSGRPQC